MKDLIKLLLTKLDKKDDIFLITLLENKIFTLNENYKSKHTISDSELRYAENGINTILRNYSYKLLKQHPYLVKINKIRDNNNCEKCKFAIEKKTKDLTYFTFNPKHKICLSCINRNNKLFDIEEKFNKKMDKTIEAILYNYKDIILLKAIINKITKKLKEQNVKINLQI